jgi:branched-chain amino acid transport system ATP-binding protein
VLSVEKLSKSFGGLQAVRDCSFKIEEGSITGLIGPNGAGKTTLFNMIAGEMEPTAGRIIFQGKDITGLPTHKMFHLGIVRTFQIPHEFAKMTVLENLMVVPAAQPGEHIFNNWLKPGAVKAREEQVRQMAEDALEFLSISHLRDERAGNLSGGQKKLLELGRTMMTDAKLVLLDEPGAGVNPTLLLKIREMITRLREERGYTFCIIEHDMELIAALCDPVIVLAEGTVLMQGTMEQVRSNPDVLDAYLGGGEEAA